MTPVASYPSPPAGSQLIFAPDRPIALDVPGCDKDDFTVYIREDKFRRALEGALVDRLDLTYSKYRRMFLALTEGKSFDVQHTLQFSDGVSRTGRIHAALCFGGRDFSVTFRSVSGRREHPLPRHETVWERCPEPELSIWEPPGADADKARENKFLFVASDISNHIANCVIGAEPEPELDGLILFAGATGTMKTQLLNGIVDQVLTAVVARKLAAGGHSERIPHVVAVGDPVETILFGRELEHAREQLHRLERSRCVDFTARVLGADVASVADAVRDAKRETPTIFIVSELRESEDFVAAMSLATTGHLVLTTSHNTSLTDAMEKLTRELKAETASARASLAQLVRAVVHLSRFEAQGHGAEPFRAILPAIWRRRPAGVQAFVSDGLSSVLTHTFPGHQEDRRFCFGYTHALRALWQKSLGTKNATQYVELRRLTLLDDLNMVSGDSDA